MEEEVEFIPYEEALELKNLGFEGREFGTFGERITYGETTGKVIRCTKGALCGSGYTKICQAPLFQQVFRWFRNKFDLHSEFSREKDNQKLYTFFITKSDAKLNLPEHIEFNEYKTMEEAELFCVRKLIQIVKEKNN